MTWLAAVPSDGGGGGGGDDEMSEVLGGELVKVS
jgi:hypothetical protein